VIFRPFSGKYLRESAEGVYTCIVCEHVLFRSDQKFESGCGWPSFSDVHAHGTVIFTKDTSNGNLCYVSVKDAPLMFFLLISLCGY